MRTGSEKPSVPASGDVPLAMIVAMARNRVIGKDNGMPWHLPAELQRFKRLTMGKPMVMGRKTHESIGRVLPGRANIVISASATGDNTENLFWAPGIESALALAQQQAKQSGADEIMVIGGAQIYQALLPEVSALYITEIELEPEGDAFFPEIDKRKWSLVEESPGESARDGAPAWRTLHYKRRSNN